MKSSSKIFDTIRIKPRRGAVEEQPSFPGCDWDGCDQPGRYKAPKGARSQGEFHNFCLEHVRHYNKAYNYFDGMSDSDIAEHMEKANAPGARATQAWGTNRYGKSNPPPRSGPPPGGAARRAQDPNNFFARVARNRARTGAASPTAAVLTAQDRFALETLGLDKAGTREEIKAAYKALVKLHHPDVNGGDRSSEDRLRAIITAYNHLKSKGLV